MTNKTKQDFIFILDSVSVCLFISFFIICFVINKTIDNIFLGNTLSIIYLFIIGIVINKIQNIREDF